MRVICVAGARPNFMKIKPVMDSLEKRSADVFLVHTGQHYDPLMSEVFLSELAIRRPDYCLEAGSGTHSDQVAKVMTRFEPLVAEIRPHVIVVVGDVNSTMACALVAAKAGPLLAHVEAGLRSRDWRMPEEVNRVVTDRVSDFLFAPSPDAVKNLHLEGFRKDQVHLVGNVMADTLLENLDRAVARPILSSLGLTEGEYGVVTLHRPTAVDDASSFETMMAALELVAIDCPLVYPVHPRARTKLDRLRVPKGIRTIDPLGYLDFTALQAGARLVLTDSGGVQEETTVIGVPCLTLRDTTERPITVTEGTNRVVGHDPTSIVAEARRVLDGETRTWRRPALWDGRAGERIADVLLRDGLSQGRPRPTALGR